MPRRIRLKHHQLAAELAKRGFSQNRWAQRLGLGRAHLSLLVNGKRRYPNEETRQKLLEGLEVPYSTLFEVEDKRLRRQRPRWMPAVRVQQHGGRNFMDRLAQDLRYAFRSLVRRPLFSGIVIGVLALAIGANAATFSWVRGLVLDPLRVAEPERFVRLAIRQPSGFQTSFSNPTFRDYERDATFFDEVFVTRLTPVSVSAGRDNQRAMANLASASYFRALGQAPLLGRVYSQDEDSVPGRDAVAVLGHAFWQRHFGADPGVVGTEILINALSFTVIGVMGAEFGMARVEPAADLMVPLTMQEQVRPGTSTLTARSSQFLQAMAVIPAATDLARVREAASAYHAALGQEFPESLGGTSLQITPAADALFGDNGHTVSAMMTLMLALVAGVLLIACANAAGLMLARAADRAHELGVRQAIGASRRRLVGQLLTESTILAVAAGALGVLLAALLNRAILAFQPPLPFSLKMEIGLDWVVLGYAAAAAMVTGIVFGVWPAFQATAGDVLPALRGSGRVSHATRSRSVLVAVQIAISVALITSAGLFARSMQNATSIDAGFDSEGLVVATLDPGLQGYSSDEIAEFYRRLVRSVESLPGVAGVSLAEEVPMNFGSQQWGAQIEGYEPSTDERMNLDYNFIGPSYFATMGIGMVTGREFGWQDDRNAEGVLIVNETMARRFWPGESPLGKRVRSGGMWREVVAVVRDSKIHSLGEGAFAYMYFPFTQSNQTALSLHVRSAAGTEVVSQQVREAVRAIDSGLPLFDMRTMGDQVSLALLPARMTAGILGAFGVFALLLAGIGLYGTLAYSVAQRNREIGIRMALGANRADVLRLVMWRGLLLGGIGTVTGLAVGAGVGRAASGVLYGVDWFDPTALGGALLVISLAIVLAGMLPARRATGIDPVDALRSD
jgi:predicted permease